MKKAKWLVASLTTIAVMPLTNLVSCNKQNANYTVTLAKEGQGVIDKESITNVPSGTYLKDLEKQINPQAYAGWKFDRYYVNGEPVNPDECQITSDITITIKFIELDKYTVTLTADGGGVIDVDSIDNIYSETLLSSLEEQINPRPKKGEEEHWYFDRLNGYYVNGEPVNPDEYKITSNINITVKFIEIETIDVGSLKYRIYKSYKEAIVSAPIASTTTDIVIPATIEHDGETYTVTSIGKSAFANCTNLTSVTINDGVTNIDKTAFANCFSLTSITIPGSVTNIGISAFEGCSSLSDTSGPDSSYGFNFLGIMEQWKNVDCGENWHLDTLATKIQCADGVYDLFLQPCTINGGSTTLSGEAGHASSDENVWVVYDSKGEPVPCTLSIEGMQQSNDFLDWIKIEGGKVCWTSDAVEGTYKFRVKAENTGTDPIYSNEITLTIYEVYTIDGGSRELHGVAKQSSSDANPWVVHNSKGDVVSTDLSIEGLETSANLPDWIKIEGGKVCWTSDAVEGTYIFRVKANLANPIYSRVITLTISAYEWGFDETNKTATILHYFGSKNELIVPSSITKDGIDYTVTSISKEAFKDCSSLTSITILTNITYIGDGAFNGCSNLTNSSGLGGSCGFKYLGNVNQWLQLSRGSNWHSGSPASRIQCSDDVCGLNQKATDFQWSFSDNNATLTKYNGVGGDIIIPSTAINGGVTCTVTSIAKKAFYQFGYSCSIEFPGTITHIGEEAFGYSYHINSIYFRDGTAELSIDKDGFIDCDGLTTVTFGKGIKNIGEDAFFDCVALRDTSGPGGSPGFRFSGTMEQWKSVSRSKGWHRDVDKTYSHQIQCSDGICGLDDK